MYLGIDVGGTKTLVAVFSDSGQITEEYKFPTPPDYPAFLQELAATVAKFTTTVFEVAVVALPGTIDRQNGVGLLFGNLQWENVPVREDCMKLFNCKVLVENDANLAGLSEALLIRSKYTKVLYVTISTGIGGVYITDGIIDPNTIDAEIGKTVYEHNGQTMEWEDFASGKAIVATYGKKASEIESPEVWQEISNNIATGLLNVIVTLTPDVVVVGGGVGAHFDKFKDTLQKNLNERINPMVLVPPVMQAQRPEEAVIYGCYDLARAQR